MWKVIHHFKPSCCHNCDVVTNLVASHHTTAANHPWTTTPIIHCTTKHTVPSTIAPSLLQRPLHPGSSQSPLQRPLRPGSSQSPLQRPLHPGSSQSPLQRPLRPGSSQSPLQTPGSSGLLLVSSGSPESLLVPPSSPSSTLAPPSSPSLLVPSSLALCERPRDPAPPECPFTFAPPECSLEVVEFLKNFLGRSFPPLLTETPNPPWPMEFPDSSWLPEAPDLLGPPRELTISILETICALSVSCVSVSSRSLPWVSAPPWRAPV